MSVLITLLLTRDCKEDTSIRVNIALQTNKSRHCHGSSPAEP